MTRWIKKLIVALAAASVLAGCAGFGHNGVSDPAIYETSLSD